ncbi:MAG: hypothetical protein P1P83_12340 [Bacteroidales bacterium]|nr:hypothetical protein [Bacteroidales bacterium]MDT8373975.1 hypothetical protein [Bacteroidales bacterium]
MDKKRTLILLHIPAWVIAIFIAWFFSADSFPGMRSSYVVLSTLVLSFWMLGSFYLFYSYLVPKFLTGGNRRLFWLYGLIFVLIIMPTIGVVLLLLTKTSALTLSEMLSAQGLLPYTGSVFITLVCGVLGALYLLLLRRYHRA